MEVLDEYDAPVPLRATFCQLISTETFERQATTHTKRALRRLFRSLDRDPALAERVVRWHKQREREGRGWASFVKARLCQALQGDFNYSNRMDAAEERWRLDQLKREMQRVYIYTREPGHSRKRRRHQGAVPAADPTLSPAPPGPSSVPAPVFMPKVFGPFPPPTHQQGENASLPELKLTCTNSSAHPQSPGLRRPPDSSHVPQRPTEPDPAGSLPWRLPLLPSARRPQQGPRALHLSAPRPQRWLPPEG
ncbi:serine/arginine repetitive matrix protein 1-like isoform X2 [Tachyglossus aculeatus]|uniref:serine/arginine repetitive matrix protein 1-like isoform X2 n=1 Tax=Tachyglossus aculeatus TaxID=9261 RepID=UPI0018F744AC|nr:serine/arginine repetitive matrix protein 1-like isoform X2 [Tachyglossus aculeatus]